MRTKRTVRRQREAHVHAEEGRRLYSVLLDADEKDRAESAKGTVGTFLTCFVRAPGWPEVEAALPGFAEDIDITINAIDEGPRTAVSPPSPADAGPD